MKLEVYQNKIVESTTKDKSAYLYSLLGLNQSVASLEEIITYNFTTKQKIVEEFPQTLYFAFKLFSDLGFVLTNLEEKYNLDKYKNMIKFYQTVGQHDHNFYLKPCRIFLGKINNIIKENLKSGIDFEEPIKIYLLNYLHNIISSIFLLIDHYNLNIDVLLEASVKNLVNENKINKKDIEKKKE